MLVLIFVLVLGFGSGAVRQWYVLRRRYESELQSARTKAAWAEQRLNEIQQNYSHNLREQARATRAEASKRLAKRLLGDDWDY
jgi:uncharacterized protein (DUF3084 family)